MVWKQLEALCTWLRITTDLQGIQEPIPFLQIFSHKVRTDALVANHKPIQKRSVYQYSRSVVQIFATVRALNPRLNTIGAIKFCLGRQFKT